MANGIKAAVFLFTAMTSALAAQAAFAQSAAEYQSPITENLQDLAESLDFIESIKASKKEINVNALQTALNRILSLSREELAGMTSDLIGLGALGGDATEKQKKYLGEVNMLMRHVERISDNVNQELSIADAIRIAQGLKAWRTAAYEPALIPIADFVSIFKNKTIITHAKNRLANIVREQKKIQSVLTEEGAAQFNAMLKKAHANIAQAASLNARAYKEDDPTEFVARAEKLVNESYDLFIAMSRLIKK
jgi:hypothetical protein